MYWMVRVEACWEPERDHVIWPDGCVSLSVTDKSDVARVTATPRRRWSAIAAELHYADQAHLIRDLAPLTGLTPTKIATRLERMTHIDVES